MDPDRSHGSSSSNNNMRDFFICFTSVPSSLGRRKSMVRSNSSLKSGQASSSMFSNGKKKGFEKNHEPSSPKVTCIGQVRAKKSKKRGKKLRACRSVRNGEANTTTSSSKKWVHLPLTICEALRGFGARCFKCFLPCTKSSSMANKRDKQDNADLRSDDETIKEQTLTQVSFDLEKLGHGDENGESVPQKEGSTSTVEEEGAEIEITRERSELECPEDESKKSVSQQDSLPDCLVLMMYEPKLSMEVSKETWVCKKDFIRQPLVKQKDGGDEPERRTILDSDPVQVSLQPSSSSCPLPATTPLVTDTGSFPLPATAPLVTDTGSCPLPATAPLVTDTGSCPLPATLPSVTDTGISPLPATAPLVTDTGSCPLLATAPLVTDTGSCPLPATLPSVTDTGISPLPATAPLVTDTGSCPLPATVPLVTDTGICPLPATLPLVTDTGICPLPATLPLATDTGSCSLPATPPLVTDTGSCPLPATPPLAMATNIGNVTDHLPATPHVVTTANLGNETDPLPATPPLVTKANLGNVTGSGGSTPTNVSQKLVGGKGYEPFVLTRCMSEPVRSASKLAKAW